MPNITYVLVDGSTRTIEAAAGATVMQTAVDAGVPGILGECGGSAMCATCHVYVDDAFASALKKPDDVEEGMLDATASPRLPNSRLGCQIVLSDALDGIVVRIPEHQQ